MTGLTLDQNVLNSWIGRQQIETDVIDANQARLMQATLDHQPTLQNGDSLPALWHWLYFPTMVGKSELGRDGHPRLGLFIPPIALPKRQWAGSRLKFEKPLQIGESATKTSTIKSVEVKEGRTGTLCFVTVEHVITHAGGDLCLTEEQDIVYREDPKTGDPVPDLPPAPLEFNWQETIMPDPVLLFRYSALTFNGHRIHYDRTYCHEVEGYAGLVVHGPLTATLLLSLAVSNQPDRILKAYEFRAVSVLVDTKPFTIAGKVENSEIALWAANFEGSLAVLARAHFE